MKDFKKNSFWLKFDKKYIILDILVDWHINLISDKINNGDFKNKVTCYDFWTWTSSSQCTWSTMYGKRNLLLFLSIKEEKVHAVIDWPLKRKS